MAESHDNLYDRSPDGPDEGRCRSEWEEGGSVLRHL